MINLYNIAGGSFLVFILSLGGGNGIVDLVVGILALSKLLDYLTNPVDVTEDDVRPICYYAAYMSGRVLMAVVKALVSTLTEKKNLSPSNDKDETHVTASFKIE